MEVLLKIYAKVIAGQYHVWEGRIDDVLGGWSLEHKWNAHRGIRRLVVAPDVTWRMNENSRFPQVNSGNRLIVSGCPLGDPTQTGTPNPTHRPTTDHRIVHRGHPTVVAVTGVRCVRFGSLAMRSGVKTSVLDMVAHSHFSGEPSGGLIYGYAQARETDTV